MPEPKSANQNRDLERLVKSTFRAKSYHSLSCWRLEVLLPPPAYIAITNMDWIAITRVTSDAHVFGATNPPSDKQRQIYACWSTCTLHTPHHLYLYWMA